MKRLLCVIPIVLAFGLSSTLPALATDGTNQSKLPLELRVPDGYNRVLHSVGRGVQIYDCVDGAWKFREPTAAIFDQRLDKVLAIHYAGPTWQSIRDGSKVVAAVKARRDAPNPQRDIPWLLLEATSNAGPGLFADVEYIQRLDTEGGVAPVGACMAGQSVSVPYTATYEFWAPAN
jgi:Protein of unknown function (DUF3455)